MNVYKFRVSLEYNVSVYRDFLLAPNNTFLDFHFAILSGFQFDKKHQATFFRSNESWAYGREISLEKYDKPYKVEPLMMETTLLHSEVNTLDQRFIYHYDFTKKWLFHVRLLNIEQHEVKEGEPLPLLVKSAGSPPEQYDIKSSVENFLEKLKSENLKIDNLSKKSSVDEAVEKPKKTSINKNPPLEEKLSPKPIEKKKSVPIKKNAIEKPTKVIAKKKATVKKVATKKKATTIPKKSKKK